MSTSSFLLVALLTAVLSAALALIGAGIVALGCVRWYAVTSFEGASGYFVVGIALVGGVLGCLIGAITAIVHHWSGTNATAWPQALLAPTGTASAIIAVTLLLAAGLAFLVAPSR